MSRAADTATAIRADLKAAFPKIKFGVVSTAHTYADSVRIVWTDGPSTDEVRDLVDKYRMGAHDALTDSYENTNLRDDVPQVKYVFLKRTRTARAS